MEDEKGTRAEQRDPEAWLFVGNANYKSAAPGVSSGPEAFSTTENAEGTEFLRGWLADPQTYTFSAVI